MTPEERADRIAMDWHGTIYPADLDMLAGALRAAERQGRLEGIKEILIVVEAYDNELGGNLRRMLGAEWIEA
jgi:hypothetical protein